MEKASDSYTSPDYNVLSILCLKLRPCPGFFLKLPFSRPG